MSREAPTRAGTRRQAALLLWLVNIALGALVGANWLVHIPSSGDEWRLLAFALPALLSTVVFLTLIPGVLFLATAHVSRSTRFLGILQGGFWTLFQVLLFVDTRIFNIFRYHFVNGQVWTLMTAHGSEDAVHIDWHIWTAIAAGLVTGTIVQSWLWRRALARAARTGVRRWMRPSIVWCFILLPAVFVEKTLYAQAELNRDRQITALARLFPLYARVPMDDLASRVFGVDVVKQPRVELDGFALNYPLERPTLAPGGPRTNILVLVIDCLRRDMLTQEAMPELSRWAEHDVRRFDNHVSGGNSTRYGVFAMLYGLYGSYWFPVLQERRGPVLVDALADAGYTFGVFSSANMNYPELRSTAWSAIPEAVHDRFPGKEPWQRDEEAAEACSTWLAERDANEPFLGFVLLDSAHQTYSYPPDQRQFSPSAEEVDYIEMTSNEGPDEGRLVAVRNRYKNAVWHADKVVGGILRTLQEAGLEENTLVFVTGDHGEEFRECGFFGHTSAFTPQQVEVPLLVRGPGVTPGVEDRPTSHIDFAPTVLEALGADPDLRAYWSLGANLLDPPAERQRVISGWNELGIWAPGGILRVPLSLLEFDVEVYDYRWRLVQNDASILDAEAQRLVDLGAGCNRFLLTE